MNGAELTVRVNIANEIAVFIMKGICIGQRTKAKDYYDLYMLAKHFKEGPKSLAESLAPHKENGLLKEALANIHRYFDSPNGLGPTLVAQFLGEPDADEREIRRRDAFEVIQAVLALVGS